MQRLASLVRQRNSLAFTPIRGPKKKGQVQAKIQSNDIINIFKQRTDPQPTDIKQYPVYVQQLARGSHSVHQLLYGTQLNIDYMRPTQPTYKQFINGLKRQSFKVRREFVQLDRKPMDQNEDYNFMNRTTVYDYFNKTKQQEEQLRKKAQAEDMEDDDELF